MGSAERASVLDAARVPVEKDLAQPVKFKVKTLRVTPDWAFVFGTPVTPDERRSIIRNPFMRRTRRVMPSAAARAVLMARDGQGWRVVTYSVGFTDVVWDSWDEEFGAPAWLWP